MNIKPKIGSEPASFKAAPVPLFPAGARPSLREFGAILPPPPFYRNLLHQPLCAEYLIGEEMTKSFIEYKLADS
ncbi:MAG: hypothetical protein NTV09_02265 [Bacteroidetes bacterium]|nr:hypothetical protein [Bacteroidota bacterium]